MHKTDLRLETVTPMFLHGPHNDTLELRPPPFKALFRYWWRATVGETDENRLREREGDLFGNTKKRSPILVRITGPVLSLSTDDYPPLPHKPNFVRKAYLPEGEFNLTLMDPNPQISQYEKIAEISFLLGGVGNRSRRGFGSIRYQNGWNFQNVPDLQNKVYQTLNGIVPGRFHHNGNLVHVSNTTLPAYPVIKAVYFGQNLWDNVNSLLQRIGQVTSDEQASKNDAVGSADPRMASPLIVRVHRIGNEFVPIVTQLNSIFPGSTPHNYVSKQTDFINAIFA